MIVIRFGIAGAGVLHRVPPETRSVVCGADVNVKRRIGVYLIRGISARPGLPRAVKIAVPVMARFDKRAVAYNVIDPLIPDVCLVVAFCLQLDRRIGLVNAVIDHDRIKRSEELEIDRVYILVIIRIVRAADTHAGIFVGGG